MSTDPARPTRDAPWARTALVGLNVALFAAMVLAGASPLTPDRQTLVRWGAQFGPLTTQGQWWRLFTCTFLHIGILHLLCNMVVLWQIGGILERLLGRSAFLVVYLLAGLAGSLASLAWNPDVVAAGASGAIFGLFGALLGFLLLDRGCLPRATMRPLARNALLFLAYNLLFGLASAGVDLAAHLGGLAGGWACGLALAWPRRDGAGPRLRPALVVLAAGLALGVAVAGVLPRGKGMAAAMEHAAQAEGRAMAAYNAAADRAQAGTLTDAQFAAIVERDVLPGLHTFRAQLAAARTSPKANTRLLTALDRYAAAREEGFVQFAQALRAQDQVEASKAMAGLQGAYRTFQEEAKAAGATRP